MSLLNRFNKLFKAVNSFKNPAIRCLVNTLGALDQCNDTSNNTVNKYTNRTHTCKELRLNNVGEKVVLWGWLEFQRMNKFVVLRDGYGQVQLLVDDKDNKLRNLLPTIPYESILKVEGTVSPRPKEMINKNQSTGEIEILVENLQVINKAKEILPFNIREFQKAKESLRMQYRYLDLRFPQMQRNLRYRSHLTMKMREFLVNNHFVDVETPTLFKATPGGAQEYVVPTRFPGQFYSLVQSPQQFKQMLMAGAIDKYFQIARCYRDEGARPDRQPEFTQLDIEMSFTNVEGVMKLIEDLLEYCLKDEFNLKSASFNRLTFHEAIRLYGSDKPDVSFDFQIEDCTKVLGKNSKLANCSDFAAHFLLIPEKYVISNKKAKELIQSVTEKNNNAKIVTGAIKSREEFVSKFEKLLGVNVANEFVEKNDISPNSLLFLAFGSKKHALSMLGKLRIEYANILENMGVNIRRNGLHFLWVTDFPLFELSDNGNLQSPHHPFTAPHPDDVHLLDKEPLKIRALSYDLVLNGNEVGGGSIRIHDPLLQKRILDLLNINSKYMSHMIEFLASGCPPHGGIALGLDRLLSILLGTTSIRDVIAFPKNHEGRDPLSGAPSNIPEKDKKLYHIETIDEENVIK
ncbi:unnamed protein product [Phyllotreta striolata]|uniref:Aminoacyl-transfer RNA synthetases class-II family profile domain-containing protein n=1 Tax=Phyllotreta striolata TaxID=444603 RepID=A0A9N9TNY1_PHYSR|nr:unnamed protein product [Phyllotreta striolata]